MISFKLVLNNPSKLAEMQELEHLRTKFEIANGATEGMFSKRWISKNVFSLSDEEFLRNQREAFYDRKYQASLEAVAEMAAQEAGGGLEGAPTDELPGTEAGGVTPEEIPTETPEETGEPSSLLASPARKEDKPREYDKSTYHPVKKIADKRKTNKSGPTTRTARSRAQPTKTRARRDIFKGSDLLNINSLYEEQGPNYKDSGEQQFLENSAAVRELINELESKNTTVEKKSSEEKAQ